MDPLIRQCLFGFIPSSRGHAIIPNVVPTRSAREILEELREVDPEGAQLLGEHIVPEDPPLCAATTTLPGIERTVTVICELDHGHDGPHHGHIDAGDPNVKSLHMAGPRSFDWPQ